MSKLVYKSINEIINKKFIGEKRTLSPEEISNAKKQANKLDQTAFDSLGKSNEMKTAITQSQLSGLEKKKKELELRKKDADKQEQQNLAQGRDREQVPENFDAQAVPGMPPVGMPSTAPPPAPMPKPAAPNYEGGHMTKTQLCQAHEACTNMMASIEDYDSLPDWLKGKITLAADYLVKCESFVNAKDQEHEDSQDGHMPKAPTPPAPAPSPMKPSTGGSPMMGIALGRVNPVSPGE